MSHRHLLNISEAYTRLLKVVVVVVRLLLFSSWLILKQQSAWLRFRRSLWCFTLSIHRPNPLVPDDPSSTNWSAWSMKLLLGSAVVKNLWSFTSSPFIRFYDITISKDMVFRPKNIYSFVSVATHVKWILCCASLIQRNWVLFLGFSN